ncbi:multidrug export protein EmrA [Rhodoblastus sphagnicola]|uniref:Multidrug export protein EmrA n=1 Tax=Rhodoblastus sphagnicola TaxID=333368 RepID=A0A2S6NEP0_9HYPH|nr:HlyD family secretion protein [Rhodoblastus sphagnicola]MBB4200665.1 membrane fusion protein (multidrug efflux system) [Rhodoblastus sphagnicola]PPQ33102.1 multidrug export protein EmrA [Rhodoblastus sphagnicola]
MSETVVETPTQETASARQPGPDAGGDGKGNTGKPSSGPGKTIGIGLVALVAAGATWHFLTAADVESTDDAFVDGRSSIVSPLVAGAVVSLDVADNQFVKKGQQLVRIDSRQYENDRALAAAVLESARAQLGAQSFGLEVAKRNFPALLAQAQAQLAAAQATAAKAQADYNRQAALSKQATSQQEVDAARAALKQAEAQVASAQAQVAQATPVPQRIGETEKAVSQLQGQVDQAQARLQQAELNLSWTMVGAPQDGWITKRNVELGNYIAPGQQIFALVGTERWVIANFKEGQLRRMKPGQKVKIAVDAYPQLDLEGHVDSIQQGSGSKFTAFPPENATGNFVKVVQRVPVKIVIDSGLDPNLPLPLGISVVPQVSLAPQVSIK